MKIQQIRNATLKVTYGGKTFLVDPWLSPKGSMGTFAAIPGYPYRVPDPVKEQLAMPFYGLPLPLAEILKDTDYYVVTHLHPDHIDIAADGSVGAPLDKEVPVLAQNETDAQILEESGFKTVKVLRDEGEDIGGLNLRKTPARHGTITPCGDACGLLFQSENEKGLYIAGDTIWYPAVKDTLERYRPGVVALNACAAELLEYGRLIMNDEDVACVHQTLPEARLVITHMDNVAHASITRHAMRGLLALRGVADYDMLADGETAVY